MRILNKIKQYISSKKHYHRSVFCVKCGSGDIGMNVEDDIYCYNCRNTMFWDKSKFDMKNIKKFDGEDRRLKR